MLTKKSALQRMSEFDSCPQREEVELTIPNGKTLRMKLSKKYSGGGYATRVEPLEKPLSWDITSYGYGATSSAAAVAHPATPASPTPPAFHQHSMRHCLHCDGYHEPVRQDLLTGFRFRTHVKINPISGTTQPCLGSELAIGEVRVRCELCEETFKIPTGLENHSTVYGFHVGIPSHYDGMSICFGPPSVVIGTQ